MSHALLHLENSKADFQKQRATIRPIDKTKILISSTKDLSQA